MESGRPAPWGDRESCEGMRSGALRRHKRIAARYDDRAVEDNRGLKRCEAGILASKRALQERDLLGPDSRNPSPSFGDLVVSDPAWKMQGVAGHHPWEVVHMDVRTSLEAAGELCQVAAEEEEAGREHRRASFRDCRLDHQAVDCVDEGRRLVRGRRPEPARRPE